MGVSESATHHLELTPPAGWQVVAPHDVGADDLALLLVKDNQPSGFTASISVALRAGEPPDVARIGSDAVRRLDATERDVRVHRREAIGSGRTEGMAQEVRFLSATPRGDVEALQLLLVLVIPGARDPDAVIVWVATFTAAARGSDALLTDFQSLVSSLTTPTR